MRDRFQLPVVALAPSPPPLEPSHSSEFAEDVVLMGDDVDVAGVSVPNLGGLFAIKLNNFLANLDHGMIKAIGCLLREKNSPSIWHPQREILQVQEQERW